MKISLRWLNDFVKIDDYFDRPAALAQILIDAGLEVETIEDLAKPFQNVVTGIILEKGKHPDADRLSLCQVTTGDGVIHQIVCGAKNHQSGDCVVVALPGAVLPGNFEIRKSKIRGVESSGMLCSEKELGLRLESEGIMILPAGTGPGIPFAKYFGVEDILFDIKVTPNRADCLSHLGLSREISCLLGRELINRPSSIKEDPVDGSNEVTVQVMAPELCPRYAGRVIKGVRIQPSPAWLSRRLESLGVRSINNIVDVTNYVMLELGQPLHAFDLSQIAGAKIKVDLAQKGEVFTTLDGTQIELQGTELMIRDSKKSLALAGIVGGQNSGIRDVTSDLFIESAYFSPATVRRTARRLGLATESSYRFSRGTNPEGVRAALDRACELIMELTGSAQTGRACDLYPNPVLAPQIAIRMEQVSEALGYPADTNEFKDWMTRLGCQVEERAAGDFNISVPPFRVDLQMDMDLIEEYARLHGYHHIPESLPQMGQEPRPNARDFDFEFWIGEKIQAQGFMQVNNTCFSSEKRQSEFLGESAKLENMGLRTAEKPVKVLNPLNEESNVLRSALVTGLAENLIHNLRHGSAQGCLYETGYVFRPHQDAYVQEQRLGFLQWGRPQGLWQKAEAKSTPVVLCLKAAIENVVASLHLTAVRWLQVDSNVPDFLHPGQAAVLEVGGQQIGFVGSLHPLWCDRHKVQEAAAIAEFDLEKLMNLRSLSVQFESVVKYPTVERDLALVMADTLAAGDVAAELRLAGQPLLQSVEIFDSYKGESLGPASKSVAYRLRFQDPNGTLSDAQIQDIQNRVINSVCQKFSVRVR